MPGRNALTSKPAALKAEVGDDEAEPSQTTEGTTEGSLRKKLWSLDTNLRYPIALSSGENVASELLRKATTRNPVVDIIYDIPKEITSFSCSRFLTNTHSDYSCIHVHLTIDSQKGQQVMARLIHEQGAPKYISSDNGPEFFGNDLREWARCQRESSPGISTLEAHAQRLYQQLLCTAQTGVSQ